MQTFKTLLKWVGWLVAAAVVFVLLANADSTERAAIGFAIFLGYLSYEVNKRLAAIASHLEAIRRQLDLRPQCLPPAPNQQDEITKT